MIELTEKSSVSQYQTPMDENQFSYGKWEKESDSVAFLHDIIKTSGLFNIYNEVPGRLTHIRPFSEYKNMRIDMILSPTQKLQKMGWLGGAIGVECKKSNTKINTTFAQAEDYAHTVWRLPSGFLFMCGYYFLWPYRKTHGFLASQMAQKRIGTLSHGNNQTQGYHFQAYCGEAKVFRYYFEKDQIEIGKLDFGFKNGSR